MTTKTKIQFCDLESDLYCMMELFENNPQIHSRSQRDINKVFDSAIKVSRCSIDVISDIEKCIELLSLDGKGSKTTVKELLTVSLTRLLGVLE
mgnify:CR=1 FL=1